MNSPFVANNHSARLLPMIAVAVMCCAGCNLVASHRVSSRRNRDESPQQTAASSEAPAPSVQTEIKLASYRDEGTFPIESSLITPQIDVSSQLRPLPPLDSEVSYAELDTQLSIPKTLIAEPTDKLARSLFESIVSDHGQFYSRRSLGMLFVGLGAGAALANTNADDWITNDFYQESIRNASTDEYFEAIHNMKVFGEGKYALPIYALAAGGGWLFDETGWLSGPGEWGERSLRTVLVGGPPMLAMQWAVGGSRPGEAHSGSHWEPLNDNNGVSGHAFMGAIPFLNAAYMTDDPWLRAACYLGSGMAGLSRVNDDSHYASQALLGWWTAYLAARSVNATERGTPFTPLVQLSPDGKTLMGLEYRW